MEFTSEAITSSASLFWETLITDLLSLIPGAAFIMASAGLKSHTDWEQGSTGVDGTGRPGQGVWMFPGVGGWLAGWHSARTEQLAKTIRS